MLLWPQGSAVTGVKKAAPRPRKPRWHTIEQRGPVHKRYPSIVSLRREASWYLLQLLPDQLFPVVPSDASSAMRGPSRAAPVMHPRLAIRYETEA